jgi:hypothetical protein
VVEVEGCEKKTKRISPTYLLSTYSLMDAFSDTRSYAILTRGGKFKEVFSFMRKMWVLQSCHCVESVNCRTYKLSARPPNDKTQSCTHPADLRVCYLICTKKGTGVATTNVIVTPCFGSSELRLGENNASHLNSTKTRENSCGRIWREVLSYLFLFRNVGGI